ncbi:MAG: P1 family peptidase [Ilumatobacteraceae bacterium]
MSAPRRPASDRSPAGCLTDVAGVAVGHHHRIGRGWRTGTTVVLTPLGVVAGVDVRGGGPGTRETDLLDPRATLSTVHAICLSGGSAFGLAAADGVMAVLEERGVGIAVGDPPFAVVPLVPTAVVFDLARGGDAAKRPDATFGRRAALAARPRPSAQGTIGAGTGTRCGGLSGGLGTASMRTIDGDTVAALAVVNAIGSVIDPASGLPYECGDDRLRRPQRTELEILRSALATTRPALNTTIGIVATDAPLTPGEVTRLAAVAHDGLARAIRPAHLSFDGDTIFSLASGTGASVDTSRRDHLLAAAADVFARACTNAVVRATGDGSLRALCPSMFPDGLSGVQTA